MRVEIRPATLNDAAAIAEILRELGFYHYLEEEPFATTAERIERHLSIYLSNNSHSVYVAEVESGRIVGYAAVHWLPSLFLPGLEAYVSDLFVRETERGQGLGSRLLEDIKAEAKNRGCFRLTLINNRQRESYQRGFYKKQGWREQEHSARFVYVLGEIGAV